MNEAFQTYNKARFQHYSQKLAEFGYKSGLALKSIEDNLRRDVIRYLQQYTSRNTTLASVLSKHEKTIRNLKKRFKEEEVVLKQNRSYFIASIVHDGTALQQDKWINFDSIFDTYIQRNAEDELFDEDILRDVLSILVAEGVVLETKQKYSSFYRTSEEGLVRMEIAESEKEQLGVVAAIADSFQNSVDEVTESKDALKNTKLTEFQTVLLSDTQVEEINNKIRTFCNNLICEYEEKALNADEDVQKKELKLVTLVSLDHKTMGVEL